MHDGPQEFSSRAYGKLGANVGSRGMIDENQRSEKEANVEYFSIIHGVVGLVRIRDD